MTDNISKHNAALSAEERSERGRKAGRRSGEARRENRLLRERITERMSDDDLTAIADNLISRAKKNSRDFEVLRDTIGQKPTDRNAIEFENAEPHIIVVHEV